MGTGFFIFLMIITVLTTPPWLFFTYKAMQAKKEYKWRGLIKFMIQKMTSSEQKTPILHFIYASAVFSIVPCLWVLHYTWLTDHSFLIGLFPLVWYYTGVRFLMFEKKDLA